MDALLFVAALAARGLDASLTRATAPGVSKVERDKALVSALNQGSRTYHALRQIGDARPDIAEHAAGVGGSWGC